jgi:hypothetical protein
MYMCMNLWFILWEVKHVHIFINVYMFTIYKVRNNVCIHIYIYIHNFITYPYKPQCRFIRWGIKYTYTFIYVYIFITLSHTLINQAITSPLYPTPWPYNPYLLTLIPYPEMLTHYLRRLQSSSLHHQAIRVLHTQHGDSYPLLPYPIIIIPFNPYLLSLIP